jgi:hypothetical protein
VRPADAAYSLTGGTGDDTFNFCPTLQDHHNLFGAVTLTGGGGTDAVNYYDQQNPIPANGYTFGNSRLSQVGIPGITLNGIASETIYGADTAGPNSFDCVGTALAITVVGGSPNGALANNNLGAPPNVTNIFDVTGKDAGTLQEILSSKTATLNFSNVQYLDGGNGGVTDFKIEPNGTVLDVTGGIRLHAGKGNWIDYSSFTTPVSVNLVTNSATNINGGAAGAILNIQNVFGGNGGNTLVGNDFGNILIGGTGADTIMGGSWRSILIGGGGQDHITGGATSGGDILIGGTTSYDGDTVTNMTALMAILAEWQSSDSFSTRFTKIDTGTIRGGYKLNWGHDCPG